jgi:hypothetical protein
MKLLKMSLMAPGCEPNTIGHRGKSYVVSNSSGLVWVDDECADFMIADGRSGATLAVDPPGDGELLRCPCCSFAWRRQPKED